MWDTSDHKIQHIFHIQLAHAYHIKHFTKFNMLRTTIQCSNNVEQGERKIKGNPQLREWEEDVRCVDQSACMWTPIAMIKMMYMQAKSTAWIRIEIPLVYMLPNSITLVLAGSWNRSPGDSRMNKTIATTTGPQSAPISLSLLISLWKWRMRTEMFCANM